ncbi:hypothetical protein LE190_12015 [Massilia oculi]|uniref:Uncharacterized protein n=1 Tax=Massilia hydrophila TaxID=3044279 RepID=A0ABS7YAC4_9BURK|nr:hypothetical protein [Massilia oculi]MCA1856643.1 hypothetical protein [Massilia oculi]
MSKDTKEGGVRQFIKLVLLVAFFAFIGGVLAGAIVRGLGSIGYPLGETGQAVVRCVMVGLVVGAALPLARRFGLRR